MMDKNFFSEEAKISREKEALLQHNRMAKLFCEDRLAFERERKRLIQNVIDSAQSQGSKKELEQLQTDINKRMKGAKSQHNRLVLIRMMLNNQVHNKFLPLLKGFQSISQNDNTVTPRFTLCKKKD